MPVPVEIMNSRLAGVSASSTSVPVDFWRISTVSPGDDLLQLRGQRAVRHLDREELDLVVPARTGDRKGAEHRLVGVRQADHHELAGAEAEGLRAGDAEGEQPVGVVLDRDDGLGVDAGGNRELPCLGLLAASRRWRSALNEFPGSEPRIARLREHPETLWLLSPEFISIQTIIGSRLRRGKPFQTTPYP